MTQEQRIEELERQNRRAAVGLEFYGPFLFFARGNGKPGMSFGVSDNGPAMAFADSAGHMRILLTMDETGTPKAVLKDSTGHVVWSAPEPPKH
jgi:hypothetical protein